MIPKGPVTACYRTFTKSRYTFLMNLTLRPTTLTDIANLPDIECSAGERFRDIPSLAWIADEHPLSPAQHQQYVEKGMSWLALVNDCPVGFLLAETLDSSLFIAEISLHLQWQGKGIGRRLIDHVAGHAREKGFTSLTLTTFRDVPWNAPFYARLGFEMLADEGLMPTLRQKREEEAARGLAYELRCAMRLKLI